MQLKETRSGEVTSWLAEMAFTLGATTREGNNDSDNIYRELMIESIINGSVNTVSVYILFNCILSNAYADRVCVSYI